MQYLTAEPITLLQLNSGGRRGGPGRKWGWRCTGGWKEGRQAGEIEENYFRLRNISKLKNFCKRGGSQQK